LKLNEASAGLLQPALADKLFDMASLLLQYVDNPELGSGWAHTCHDPETDQFSDCIRCQQALFLYQAYFLEGIKNF
jgi:hypothetical protein